MKIIYPALMACTVLLASCGNKTKKVIIYANDDAVINQDAKAITQKDNEGHLEKELSYNAGGEVDLKVQQKDGSQASLAMPEAGYYIANVKAKDTILGGLQKYTTPEEANRVMTQEQLHHNIDSLEQLIQGKNASAANHTFFIPPNTITKITSNTDATIVGPYHQMTTVEQKGAEAPEVYRFYTISEVRETLDKLKKLTGETPEEGKKDAEGK